MRSVHVLRKPCSEPTVATNVLRWGTGAINVDATRVASGGEHMVLGVVRRTSAPAGDERAGASLGWWRPGHTFVPTNHVGGRWPANLVLQHLDGCVQEGTRKVKSGTAHQDNKTVANQVYSGSFNPHGVSGKAGYADPDGTETVVAWSCAPGCPVAGLDSQSGVSKTPTTVTRGAGGRNGRYGPTGAQGEIPSYADTGGASRFFKQVKP